MGEDQGPGASFSLRLNNPANVEAARARSRELAAAERDVLAGVEAFCLFVGHARSGHTLVGSLLNAHPEVVIAHELNVLRVLQRGFDREQIGALLLERDRDFGAMGRQWTGYDYEVPGQWQGRFRHLRVLGDKRAGATTHELFHQPALLDRLQATMGVPLRVIYVVRNPFDNIARMVKRHEAPGEPPPFETAVDRYFRHVRIARRTQAQLGGEGFHVVHLDDLVRDPRVTLADVCRFFGLDAPDDWAAACAGVVSPAPSGARHQVAWTPEVLADVARRIGNHPHLARYRFDDDEPLEPAQR